MESEIMTQPTPAPAPVPGPVPHLTLENFNLDSQVKSLGKESTVLEAVSGQWVLSVLTCAVSSVH